MLKEIILSGPLRTPIIVSMLLHIIFLINSAVIFYMQSQKHDYAENSKIIYNSWAVFWIFLFIGKFLQVINDFLIDAPSTQKHFLSIIFCFTATGGLFFTIQIKKIKFIPKGQAFVYIYVSMYTLSVILAILSLFLDEIYNLKIIGIIFWFPLVIILYFYNMAFYKKSKGKNKAYSLFLIIGSIIFSFGFLGSSEIAIQLFGDNTILILISEILTMSGILLIVTSHLKLPSWEELDWLRPLYHLFVFYKGGSIVFNYKFNKPSSTISLKTLLLPVALETTKNVLNEVFKGTLLKILDMGNYKILFSDGENISAALASEQVYSQHKSLLNNFVKEFETIFKEFLSKRYADTETFLPARKIVERIFYRKNT
ncbi:MAG: hypothetical protein ACTSVI_00355 [Promethearchaeota archaeon]